MKQPDTFKLEIDLGNNIARIADALERIASALEPPALPKSSDSIAAIASRHVPLDTEAQVRAAWEHIREPVEAVPVDRQLDDHTLLQAAVRVCRRAKALGLADVQEWGVKYHVGPAIK